MSDSPPVPDSALPPLFLWRGGWLMLLPSLHNRPHRHVAASLLVGLDGDVRVDADGEVMQGRVVLVAPEREQDLASDGPVAVIHLDPDEPAWCALKAHGLSTARQQWLCQQLGQLAAAPQPQRATVVIEALREGAESAPLDPRIARCCQYLKDSDPLPGVAVLAARAGLSESRFRHLFREQMGVTLKRYLLHLKCQRALMLWKSGMSFTELAVAAGFYDQPHLNRTLRAMFDALPSRYARERPVRIVHLPM
ncbi:putative transcriptional regulator [Alcanivorax hongdengensis A-11-3]|uniref:Putative transcriptional regulator n=1 Tax=Alcanivorax hongdengensis A-11-3 TaxID=1177179 RepID=L0WAC5_9GAMM|nr:helix-turn-helix domain-containing protein [Alcanivorax hongdengensis]EKF73728.1 putative transcriptional regulator [Alcanivorax hongdengensis A-11-3]